VQRTKIAVRSRPSDPAALERAVRQLLCDKVSGTHVGLWLLIPEHLRLGTWELLCGWSAQRPERLEPRLALQLVHESALCATNLRARRCLSQKGFELANGLPFLAADSAIHDLLDAHTVEQALALQSALGKIRRAAGHFQARTLAVDPHRMRSYSKRQMRRRKQKNQGPAVKTAQVFFCLDADTRQPVGFTIGSAARTAAQAAPELLELAQAVLRPSQNQHPLVVLDAEHYDAALFEHARLHTPFDLLAPLPDTAHLRRRIAQLAPQQFTPRWAGFATAVLPYQFTNSQQVFYHLIQRCGERPQDERYKSFLSTSADNELQALTEQFPKRWHVEEFFNAHQALGWNRAGTLNLNIRYAHMTMALLAQAALHQLRTRLGDPWQNAEASCLARDLFASIDGDLRVHGDTIRVTLYNAPHADRLRPHFENTPDILRKQNVDPRIPWLYNYKLDFRFA